MADAPKPSDSVPELAGALVKKLVPREALLLGAFAALMLGAGGGLVWAAEGHLDERVDAGVAVEANRRADLSARFEEHVREETAARRRLEESWAAKEERDAKRFDALYQTILSRQPQPEAAELARPAPAPDGGRGR